MPDPLDKLQALGDEATEGPWVFATDQGAPRYVQVYTKAEINDALVSADSARFIAVSRNVWDELLAVAKAAQAVRDVPKGGMRAVEAMNALSPSLDALYARIDQEVPDAQ